MKASMKGGLMITTLMWFIASMPCWGGKRPSEDMMVFEKVKNTPAITPDPTAAATSAGSFHSIIAMPSGFGAQLGAGSQKSPARHLRQAAQMATPPPL
jgi:hypothetical protein